MSEARARPRWVRLGNELRRLRELAGLTQRDIARALRISQTTVDRIEKGGPAGKPPSWPAVQAWAERSSGASPDLAMLREMTEDALAEHFLFRNLLTGGLAAVQEEVQAEEAAARTQRLFNPWGIPGLLQTEDYARRILAIINPLRPGGPPDLDAALANRMRRQEVLHKTGHSFGFVLTEQALRMRPGTVQVQRNQLAQVASLAALPSVTLSAIPADVRMHAIPRDNFVLYEDRTDGGQAFAAVEIDHRRVPVEKQEDVDFYRAQYELLSRSALHADEAVAFVREVAQSL